MYALIISKKDYVVLFILTPILLVSSIYTGYAIFALQGTPIDGIPEGEVEIAWVEPANPDIFFVARHTDPDLDNSPKLYRIDYTKNNVKALNEAQQRAAAGAPKAKGKFEKKSGDESDGNEIKFDRISREPLPPKRSELEAQGVDRAIIDRIQTPIIQSNPSSLSSNP